MPLAKSHANRRKINRQVEVIDAHIPDKGGEFQPVNKRYMESEALIDEVYVDIANGVSRSHVLKKLMGGLYNHKALKKRQADNYYDAALGRFATDCDIEAEKLRQMFFGRYEAVFEECIRKGDMYNARATLDSMARIFGIEKKTPDTAIQINGSDDGKIVVNFGLTDGSSV